AGPWPMVAPGGSSGKSIVIMISISYFLRPYGPSARPARNARRGRAPRLVLARRPRAPPEPARGEHAGAPARAGARPLLERVGKRAFPTKAGELLLAHAGRALRELETGLEVVQQLRGIVAGRIRLGTSASFSIYLLPPALRR